MGRGKVFPAASARSLLNPARRLVQSPAAHGGRDRRRARRSCARTRMWTGLLQPGSGARDPWVARAAGSASRNARHCSRSTSVGRTTVAGAGRRRAVAVRERILRHRVHRHRARRDSRSGRLPRRGATDRTTRRRARHRRDPTRQRLHRAPRTEDAHRERGFRFAEKHGPAWQYVARFRPD